MQEKKSKMQTNLVDGDMAYIESTDNSFESFEIHYAETAIIPEIAGDYKLVSPNGETVMLIAARVRI